MTKTAKPSRWASSAESVWVIQRGWVYLVRRTPQGTPVTIFTVTPEEVLCGFSAVVGQSAYYASMVVILPQKLRTLLDTRPPS